MPVAPASIAMLAVATARCLSRRTSTRGNGVRRSYHAQAPSSASPSTVTAAATAGRLLQMLVSLSTRSTASSPPASSRAPGMSTRAERPGGGAGMLRTAVSSATIVTAAPSP